jgi:hypothetical protein
MNSEVTPMLHVLLLIFVGMADAKAPLPLPPPGPVGFALCCIESDGNFKGDYEAMLIGYVYGADLKMIGKYRRGDVIGKPFQDWRVVGFPQEGKRPSMVVTNVKTKQTIELEVTDRGSSKPPSTRPLKIH